MALFDLFNGDADGICSLIQLRLEEPRDSTLITGVKRDINLLARVEAVAGDRITVLDVSMDKNRSALDKVLQSGADVFYVDHHFPGDIPEHAIAGVFLEESEQVLDVHEAPHVIQGVVVDGKPGVGGGLHDLAGIGDGQVVREPVELDAGGHALAAHGIPEGEHALDKVAFLFLDIGRGGLIDEVEDFVLVRGAVFVQL